MTTAMPVIHRPRKVIGASDLNVGDMLNSGRIIIEVGHYRGRIMVELLDGGYMEFHANDRTIVVDD